MTAPRFRELSRHASRFAAPRGECISSIEESTRMAAHGVAGFAADFLAWRRSALLLTTIVVFAGAVAQSLELALRWRHHAVHRTELGVWLELVGMRMVGPWLVALLCAAALARWDRLRPSMALVVAAAAIDIVPPFLLAMLPPHWLVEPTLGDAAIALSHALRLALAASLALRLVGLLSAAFRGSVVAKLLLPESPVPGATIAALVPINVGFAVAGYVGVNSVVQGWAFFGAWLCIVLYQLAYVVRGTRLLHPQTDAEVLRAFQPALRARLLLMPAAALLLGLFLFTGTNSLGRPLVTMDWLGRHWLLLVGVATNYALTLVVAVDLMVRGVAELSAHRAAGDAPRRVLLDRLAEKGTSLLRAAGDRTVTDAGEVA